MRRLTTIERIVHAWKVPLMYVRKYKSWLN
jgi:hypothetical protein